MIFKKENKKIFALILLCFVMTGCSPNNNGATASYDKEDENNNSYYNPYYPYSAWNTSSVSAVSNSPSSVATPNNPSIASTGKTGIGSSFSKGGASS